LSIKTNFTARGLNMDNKGKQKSFTISDQRKVNILVQVDAYIVELASCLRLSVSTLNTIVKNHGKIDKVHPVWTLLQAVEITEMFATRETGICTSCIVEASM
jgi:hypothetical protein